MDPKTDDNRPIASRSHLVPEGVRFYDAATRQEMILCTDDGSSWNGWLLYKHLDGHWVSLRKATPEDQMALLRKVARKEHRVGYHI
jgi:hypothetical protein